MKFREYGEVEPVVITCPNSDLLEDEIEKIGNEKDIIDLQYSTGFDPREGIFWYSALLLVKEK